MGLIEGYVRGLKKTRNSNNFKSKSLQSLASCFFLTQKGKFPLFKTSPNCMPTPPYFSGVVSKVISKRKEVQCCK